MNTKDINEWIMLPLFCDVHPLKYLKLYVLLYFKACVLYQIFIFLSNDRPSKTMKNVFYFI